MGLWPSKLATTQAAKNVIPFPKASNVGIISPWQTGSLAPIIASDIWGLTATPMTVLEMMRVPAVVKARAILHSILSRPLRAYDAKGVALDDDKQPTWLYRTNTGIPPQLRLKLMLDDLIFHEATLLQVQRGAKPEGAKYGPILDAWHVARDRWIADDKGEITIDQEPVIQDDLIWIPGPGPGLLIMAGETARGSRRMAQAWISRVESPFPMLILHENEDTGMNDEEVKEYVKAVVAARQDPTKAVMFVPYNIDVDAHPSEQTDLFEQGRNAERIDYANFFNMPTSLLDGSVSTSTLTYSTQEGKRNEVQDYTVPYWLTPLTSRLSMDDVVPRGISVDMDFSDYLTPIAPPTGPTEQD